MSYFFCKSSPIYDINSISNYAHPNMQISSFVIFILCCVQCATSILSHLPSARYSILRCLLFQYALLLLLLLLFFYVYFFETNFIETVYVVQLLHIMLESRSTLYLILCVLRFHKQFIWLFISVLFRYVFNLALTWCCSCAAVIF